MIVPERARVGFWVPSSKECFIHKGFYVGPELGDVIVGTKMTQELMEGTITFIVEVLYRPDLPKKQRLETVLVLKNHIPDMWEYDTWEIVAH